MIDRSLTTLSNLIGQLHKLARDFRVAGYEDLADQTDQLRTTLIEIAKNITEPRSAA